MPFKESPEGQTHSFNDGCGEPEHNQVMADAVEELSPDEILSKATWDRKAFEATADEARKVLMKNETQDEWWTAKIEELALDCSSYSEGVAHEGVEKLISFVSSLLAQERERIILKGERNRIIMSLREEERTRVGHELLGKTESLKEYSLENSHQMTEEQFGQKAGWNACRSQVLALLVERKWRSGN